MTTSHDMCYMSLYSEYYSNSPLLCLMQITSYWSQCQPYWVWDELCKCH